MNTMGSPSRRMTVTDLGQRHHLTVMQFIEIFALRQLPELLDRRQLRRAAMGIQILFLIYFPPISTVTRAPLGWPGRNENFVRVVFPSPAGESRLTGKLNLRTRC